jgi:hypothetical protein
MIDLWKISDDKAKFYVSKLNLSNPPKTLIGYYIILAEYYGRLGYFTDSERRDLANRTFRKELINDNMNMNYNDRIEYITKYLEARKERSKVCFETYKIKAGKLIKYNFEEFDLFIREFDNNVEKKTYLLNDSE